jgi:hypothetical protein
VEPDAEVEASEAPARPRGPWDPIELVVWALLGCGALSAVAHVVGTVGQLHANGDASVASYLAEAGAWSSATFVALFVLAPLALTWWSLRDGAGGRGATRRGDAPTHRSRASRAITCSQVLAGLAFVASLAVSIGLSTFSDQFTRYGLLDDYATTVVVTVLCTIALVVASHVRSLLERAGGVDLDARALPSEAKESGTPST